MANGNKVSGFSAFQTMSSGIGALATKQQLRLQLLKEKYGESSDFYKAAGAASLIGADIAEYSSIVSNSEINQANIALQQREISERATDTIAILAQDREKVLGAQAAAFTKGGVKLEGSALDVMQETITNASEAMAREQREADFQNTQLEIEKRMSKRRAKDAGVQTLLSMGSSLASIY